MYKHNYIEHEVKSKSYLNTYAYCITRIIGEPYIWQFTLKMLLVGF